MKVTILGLGYVGLPTAALIAGKGIKVFGVDVNPKVVRTINRGKIQTTEPELSGMVHHAVSKGFLVASGKVSSSDVFLVAVPTPLNKNKKPVTSFVEKATRKVIPLLKPGNLLIIESTVPVGLTMQLANIIFRNRPELKDQVFIAYCPERVLPGNISYELQENDRVIGGINDRSTEAAVKFYRKFVRGKLHTTDSRTAEMCKLAENAFRDVNIAFANELSMTCDAAGIDVNTVIEIAGKHPRVKILNPGPGVGGHCIALDPWFIVSAFPSTSRLVRSAREVNTKKSEWVLTKVRSSAKKFKRINGRSPVIACMGLTYKEDIDDMRESPSLGIYLSLKKEKFRVLAVDPNIRRHPKLKITKSYKAITNADIIVYLVPHKEFRSAGIPREKIVLDFCGITHIYS